MYSTKHQLLYSWLIRVVLFEILTIRWNMLLTKHIRKSFIMKKVQHRGLKRLCKNLDV